MLFKIDENIPLEVTEIFNTNGYNCENVYQEKLNGKSDIKLSLKCKKEGRVLITLDLDFSDIRAYPLQDYPGFIILRLNNQSKENIISLVKQVIPKIKEDDLKNCLWIVDKKKIRIRSED